MHGHGVAVVDDREGGTNADVGMAFQPVSQTSVDQSRNPLELDLSLKLTREDRMDPDPPGSLVHDDLDLPNTWLVFSVDHPWPPDNGLDV
jgi:hypothetical protein